ncbi:hypothetical protein [Haloplanus sp. C73]|uniref:hypothetical protein n=1 Tax=Haloplanus sp. C73 TaxID=3421641 RepID=UPI003EBCAEF0
MSLRAELTPHTVAVGGGGVYATLVLWWLFSSGVSVSGNGTTVIFGIAYAWIGMFLTGAVPLYLFGRLSLVTPPLATLWILGDTVYQWAYGAHLHPLSSYLTVWPLLLGLVLVVSLGEAVVRRALYRTTGRFGLSPVF